MTPLTCPSRAHHVAIYAAITCHLRRHHDGKIRAHEAEAGNLLWAMDNCHRGGVSALALSHNLKFLVSGGEEGEVRVWEIRSESPAAAGRTHARRAHVRRHTARASPRASHEQV
eukprot:3607530-Prymnesium_polylepis.1